MSNQLSSIIFAGTPDLSAQILQYLIKKNWPITSVYSQADKPVGRGQKLTPTPVKQVAFANDLRVYQPKNFKAVETVDELKQQQPDLMIVVAYGMLLPQAVLDIPKYGCVNIHASLLPRWRGASPIQQAILAGDQQSGVSIMQMDAGLDTGDVLLTKSLDLANDETAKSLHDKLIPTACQAIEQYLQDLEQGHLQPKKQDDNLACYAPKINKKMALVDWQQAAEVIARQVRAFSPWPVSHSYINDSLFKIHQAHAIAGNQSQAPGTLIKFDKSGIYVATGSGALVITQLQIPGGKVLAVSDFINAKSQWLTVGESFKNSL